MSHVDPAERSAYYRRWRLANKDRLREKDRRHARNGKKAEWLRKSVYGIEQQDYDRLLIAQGGACAICREPFSEGGPCVDHDHASGKVRGLLHKQCNSLLGMAADNPAVLEGAAGYLRDHR